MNLRKNMAIVGLAGAAALLPTAAVAEDYPDEENPTRCDLSAFEPGASVRCIVTYQGGESAGMSGEFSTGQEVGIAGATATVTKPLVDGSASFDISVPDAQGGLSLTTFVDGEVVDTMTIAIQGEGAAVAAQVSSEQLTQTGFSNGPLAIGVFVLLAAGGGAVLVAAKRSRQQTSA